MRCLGRDGNPVALYYPLDPAGLPWGGDGLRQGHTSLSAALLLSLSLRESTLFASMDGLGNIPFISGEGGAYFPRN